MNRFWLGTHRPGWLETLDVPLMVSRRQLAARAALPRARVAWVLDSGGFTELSKFGGWSIDAATYAGFVRRCVDEVGRLEWAAPQDWMCEPSMLARTGLTVAEHQERTIDNLIELRTVAVELPIIPVLQGWAADDYLRHVDRYTARGIDLTNEPLVGVGSVCRRHTAQHAVVEQAIRRLAGLAPLHGFGVSIEGLALYGDALESSDSLAWSDAGRRERCHRPGCHLPCSRLRRPYSPANCPGCAVAYRSWLIAGGARPTLFVGVAP